MMRPQPIDNDDSEIFHKADQFFRVLKSSGSDEIIFDDVSFCAAYIQIISVRAVRFSQDQRNRLNSPIMMGKAIRPVAFRGQ